MAGRIVVVGAGLAGLRTAEALRSQGWDGEIDVFGDEPHGPYNRPPLSKELLLSAHAHADVAFRLRGSIDDVRWHLGAPVANADLTARTITLADGTDVGYDGLVAASGVRARRVPSAVGRADCHTLRTLEDSLALGRALSPGATVAVIGAGFIGCEAAAALATAGFDVHVVEADSEAMLRPLGAVLGRSLRERHEGIGVTFHLGRRVEAITGPDGAPVVCLDDGLEVPAAAVIEAVGSQPNTEWLDGNGLDLTDGVRCDADLRIVGADAAVAVGDVARYPNLLFDDVPRRIEHWQMASVTAKRASTTLRMLLKGTHNLAAEPFTPVPWFWSDQAAVKLQAFGVPALGTEMELVEGDLGGDLAARFVREGVVVGVVLIGPGTMAARYRDAVGVPA
ncbi:NAD(P)/FAD-dependent oxidoreductase [Georgenia yuyongxinii]|uniref:NAD(P)/FAD-dependent oxidoreductase n=1 Tax=Georgenia yuyongxinii TaxID=2589797 RepID=A0A552WY78_9MICO|nr:FAD-dependent oxidoreductase [Georgenia yuyongxinii]TRW47635.1 NAD(P)/FAD-dependent oxidoreductase [Georgenia yuyongxinii]